MAKKLLCLALWVFGLFCMGFACLAATVTVVMYYEVGPEAAWPNAIAVWNIAQRFQEFHPDIKLEFLHVPFEEFLPTITRWAMVGALPDIVALDNPDVGYAAVAGVYTDLTPLVEAWNEWEDFFVGARHAVTYEGRVWAIPFGTNNLALIYNKRYFEKFGLVPPKTWNELLNLCAQLAELLEGTGTYPIGFIAGDHEALTWQFLPFLWSNGGSLLELDKPESVAALNLWVTLVQQGYAPRDVLTWISQWIDPLVGEQVVMMVNGPWILPALKAQGFDYGIAPLPTPYEGAPIIVPMGGETFGISADVDPTKIAPAWEFIKFFVAPENMADFCVTAGYVPTRAAAVSLVIERNPELEVFANQAMRSLPRPPMGGGELYPEVSAIARRYVQLALAGAMTAEEAFARASSEIRALFPSPEAYRQAVEQARNLLAQVRGD